MRTHSWVKGKHSKTLPLHQWLMKCCWGAAEGHMCRLVSNRNQHGGLWAFFVIRSDFESIPTTAFCFRQAPSLCTCIRCTFPTIFAGPLLDLCWTFAGPLLDSPAALYHCLSLLLWQPPGSCPSCTVAAVLSSTALPSLALSLSLSLGYITSGVVRDYT